MPSTLGQVKAAFQARGYGTDTTTAQTELVKSALRRIYGMRRWRFLRASETVTLAAGANTINLTGRYRRVDAVRASDTRDIYPLDRADLFDVRSHDTLADPGDVPQQWAYSDDDTLEVWPKADKSYSIIVDYVQSPTMPATDSDTLVFPDDHLEVLVEYVGMLMAKRQRDWQAYNAAKADFTDALTDMIRSQSTAAPGEVERWEGWDQVES